MQAAKNTQVSTSNKFTNKVGEGGWGALWCKTRCLAKSGKDTQTMIGIIRLEKCKVQTSLSVLYNKYQLVVLQKPLYDTHSIVSCLSYRGCGLCCRNNGMGHARKTLPGFLSDKRAPICLSTVRFVLRIQGGKRLVGEAPISFLFWQNPFVWIYDRITLVQ